MSYLPSFFQYDLPMNVLGLNIDFGINYMLNV